MTVANTSINFRTHAFINGEFVQAADGKRLTTINPATGEALAEVAACDQADVEQAVRAARGAFDDGRWSRQSPEQRKIVLLRFAELLELHAEELALLDSLEAGKPITDCREIDIPETVRTFRWHAEAIDKVFDSIAPTGPGSLGLIVREPLGVVGAVLPWNFPSLMLSWKAAPALAAGNSVIVKPAEQSSLSALRMAELAADAGVPDGVFNVVSGYGESAGQALGRHMDVDMVSFTGSTEVGRLFLRYAAESNLKEIVLECGGKSPQVVMADPPQLDVVVEEVLAAGFWNMGENCTCGSRLIVHSSVKDKLLEKLVARTSDWVVGNPLDPETKIGPLVEEQHLEKVLGYIRTGQADGAEVVVGGDRTLKETGGFFVQPTILDGVRHEARIAQEEVFGPVIATMAFDTAEEAIAIANGTTYGLAASVWTTNLDTAVRMSRAIKAGTVSVNSYSEGDVTTPFGGYKQSGFGGRDKGLEGLHQYTQLKTIWVTLRDC